MCTWLLPFFVVTSECGILVTVTRLTDLRTTILLFSVPCRSGKSGNIPRFIQAYRSPKRNQTSTVKGMTERHVIAFIWSWSCSVLWFLWLSIATLRDWLDKISLYFFNQSEVNQSWLAHVIPAFDARLCVFASRSFKPKVVTKTAVCFVLSESVLKFLEYFVR